MTLRQLVPMAEGKLRHDWQRTASTMALIANIHRSPGRRAFRPADFDPFAVTKTAPLTVLRDVFVDRRVPR